MSGREVTLFEKMGSEAFLQEISSNYQIKNFACHAVTLTTYFFTTKYNVFNKLGTKKVQWRWKLLSILSIKLC